MTVDRIALLLMGQVLHGLECWCTWKQKMITILQASNTYPHLNICTEGKYKQGTSKLWTTGIVGWHRLTGGKRWCVLRLSDSIRAVTRLASRILAMLGSTCTESRLRLEMTCLRRWQAANNVLMNTSTHTETKCNLWMVAEPGVPH